MELTKKFLATITIQSFGSIAIFLAIFLIARVLGPEVQGRFSEVKAFIDLLVAGLLLGLPQSFVFGINKLRIPRGQLSRWSMKYGVAAVILVTAVILAFPFKQSGILPIRNFNFVNALFIALSIAGLLVNALLRGILLTANDGWQFSFITILPTLFLCVTISLLLGANRFDPVLTYAIAGILSALVSIYYTRPLLSECSDNALPWKNLLTNGSTAFVQTTVMAFQPFLTFTLLRRAGAGYEEIAFFSLASYFYQASILPLTMVSPLLFNRWSSAMTKNDVVFDLKNLAWSLIVIAFGITAAWHIAPILVPMIFGSTYKGAAHAVQLILLGVPFMYIAYVGMTALMAIGKFRINALMAIVRLLSCSLIFSSILLGSSSDNKSEQAAMAWTTAESLMALMVLVALMKYFYAPIKTKIDISN